MFGMTDPSRPRKRKKKLRALEFDFDNALLSGNEEAATSEADLLKPDDSSSSSARKPTSSSDQPEPEPSRIPATPIMNASHHDSAAVPPGRIRATDNIQRQKREQAAVYSLMSGVGLAFTSAIIFVAALAALGGYVLYKQLSDQSASLALLEQNTKQRFFEMETDLIRRDSELARNLEQANLRLLNVSAAFEEHRSETARVLAELRSTNKRLSTQLQQAREENAEHRMQIARLESKIRVNR